MRFVRPRWLRFTYAAASLLLTGVVLAALSQAGKPYVWCQSLQQVMPHSCCPAAASERASTPVSSVVADDCCQTRNMPLLDDWTPASRGSDVSAPFVAILFDAAIHTDRDARSAAPAGRDPTMRTGPPRSRVLAQLMVLRI